MSSANLIHGECLAEMAKLPLASVDCVVCDLPYGTTQNKWDSVIPMADLWAAWKRICKPGAPIVLFTQQPFTTTVAASNLKQLKTEWIWEKPQGTGHLNAKLYPMKSHENILVFCDRTPLYNPQMKTGGKPYICHRGGGTSTNYGKQIIVSTINDGTRYPTTILSYARDSGKQHATQKPVALCEYLIRTYSNPGDTVLDCCMGSGTTIVAALNTGRNAIGVEQDPTYFAIARERVNAVLSKVLPEAA